MSVLDCLFTSPYKKQLDAAHCEGMRKFEIETQLAQATAYLRSLTDAQPKPRQSTLRVRRIRWKAGLHVSEIEKAIVALTAKGAAVNAYNGFGLYGKWYGVVSDVTWPRPAP